MSETLCVWSEDDEGNWFTNCDNAFTFIDGSPYGNEMKFCCYCGKGLAQDKYHEPEANEGKGERMTNNEKRINKLREPLENFNGADLAMVIGEYDKLRSALKRTIHIEGKEERREWVIETLSATKGEESTGADDE